MFFRYVLRFARHMFFFAFIGMFITITALSASAAEDPPAPEAPVLVEPDESGVTPILETANLARLEFPFDGYVQGSNVEPRLCGDVSATSYTEFSAGLSLTYTMPSRTDADGCRSLRRWNSVSEYFSVELSTGESWSVDAPDTLTVSPDLLDVGSKYAGKPPLPGIQTIRLAAGAAPGQSSVAVTMNAATEPCVTKHQEFSLPAVVGSDGSFSLDWDANRNPVKSGGHCKYVTEFHVPLRDGGEAVTTSDVVYHEPEADIEPVDEDCVVTDGTSTTEGCVPGGASWTCPVGDDENATSRADWLALLQTSGFRDDWLADLDLADADLDAATKQFDKAYADCLQRLKTPPITKLPKSGGDIPAPWFGIAGLGVLAAAGTGVVISRRKSHAGRE